MSSPIEEKICKKEESSIKLVGARPMRSREGSGGILRLDIKPRLSTGDVSRGELPSPQPSVDRLSVTFATEERSVSSDTSVKVNLFIPDTPPISRMEKVRFPTITDEEDSEDYSASVTAIMQRRASVRKSKKKGRRTSSPFSHEDLHSHSARRRSSIYTTSSGDTAMSLEESIPHEVAQDQIFENIKLHKEVLSSVKMQPWGMRRKLKLVLQAKSYIKKHQGVLQERLAQSKSTKDMLARCNILMTQKIQHYRREIANISNWLIPWESRIKEIESHFGSVVASYFTFLRWLFWVNLIITIVLVTFVIVPEVLTNDNPNDDRKNIIPEDKRKSTDLFTLYDFEGVLRYSPMFYGYYTNTKGILQGYRLPFAYFMTGLAVYVYSFVATLRKMAKNSRMSKLSEKDDECVFSWKLFTGWDYMIGNAETAHNRVASIILGFKEALLEEAEKKRQPRNWKIISIRILVNMFVIILLGASAYAVVNVVQRSTESESSLSWWRRNEITVVMSSISLIFPLFFEVLGLFERYHPRKQLRMQLARIMVMNLLNLYSLIFALFVKIEVMTTELKGMKPNTTDMSTINTVDNCIEKLVDCNDTYQYDTSISTSNDISHMTTNLPYFVNYNQNNDVRPKRDTLLDSNELTKNNQFLNRSTSKIDYNNNNYYEDYKHITNDGGSKRKKEIRRTGKINEKNKEEQTYGRGKRRKNEKNEIEKLGREFKGGRKIVRRKVKKKNEEESEGRRNVHFDGEFGKEEFAIKRRNTVFNEKVGHKNFNKRTKSENKDGFEEVKKLEKEKFTNARSKREVQNIEFTSKTEKKSGRRVGKLESMVQVKKAKLLATDEKESYKTIAELIRKTRKTNFNENPKIDREFVKIEFDEQIEKERNFKKLQHLQNELYKKSLDDRVLESTSEKITTSANNDGRLHKKGYTGNIFKKNDNYDTTIHYNNEYTKDFSTEQNLKSEVSITKDMYEENFIEEIENIENVNNNENKEDILTKYLNIDSIEYNDVNSEDFNTTEILTEGLRGESFEENVITEVSSTENPGAEDSFTENFRTIDSLTEYITEDPISETLMTKDPSIVDVSLESTTDLLSEYLTKESEEKTTEIENFFTIEQFPISSTLNEIENEEFEYEYEEEEEDDEDNYQKKEDNLIKIETTTERKINIINSDQKWTDDISSTIPTSLLSTEPITKWTPGIAVEVASTESFIKCTNVKCRDPHLPILQKPNRIQEVNDRRKRDKHCWETMFGQELVKLTVMDLVFTILSTLTIDFFRAVLVRVMNNCWCWDLEKQFPQYGDFKIAENILHLVNNQGLVWMGMFFSPGITLLNLIKLAIIMYLRSWAVLTCNVPHEVVFRASRSNNFYLALLLTMLFLCVLPVGYAIVWVDPSWHCGPFSNYSRIFHIFTETLRNALPKRLQMALDYIASPGIVIPLLVLLVLIIYYMISLTNSLREANNDLKLQLRRERTEERRKMFQIVDRRRRGGSADSGDDNTPFGKWKKLLPMLPTKSIDGDVPNKDSEEVVVNKETIKKDFLTKLLRKVKKSPQPDEENVLPPHEDGTDTEHHESLPDDSKEGHTAKSTPKPICRKTPPSDTDSYYVKEQKKSVRTKIITRRDTFENRKEEIRRSSTKSTSSKDLRHDSLSSNWSDNIPVITVTKTESSECILEQETVPNKKKMIHQENIDIETNRDEENKLQIAEPQCPTTSSNETLVTIKMEDSDFEINIDLSDNTDDTVKYLNEKDDTIQYLNEKDDTNRYVDNKGKYLEDNSKILDDKTYDSIKYLDEKNDETEDLIVKELEETARILEEIKKKRSIDTEKSVDLPKSGTDSSHTSQNKTESSGDYQE